MSEELESWIHCYRLLEEERQRLSDENAQLRESLKWYAQEWLYDMPEFVRTVPLSMVGGESKSETIKGNPVQFDRGRKARAALEASKK